MPFLASARLVVATLFAAESPPIKAPGASRGTETLRTDWHGEAQKCAAALWDMGGGVVSLPAVPGLAPGACM